MEQCSTTIARTNPIYLSNPAAKLVLGEVWGYREDATEGMYSVDAPDEMIVVRALACDEPQRIDALVRSKTLLRVAMGCRQAAALIDGAWDDPAFELVRRRERQHAMFATVVVDAAMDMPKYYDHLMNQSAAECNARKTLTAVR